MSERGSKFAVTWRDAVSRYRESILVKRRAISEESGDEDFEQLQSLAIDLLQDDADFFAEIAAAFNQFAD